MLSDLRRRKLEKVFASFDPDADGVITRADLLTMAGVWCQVYELPAGSAGNVAVHDSADRWWSGIQEALGGRPLDRLTLAEWLDVAQQPAFADFVEKAAIPFSMAVFAVADADGDGRITVEEMSAAQSRTGMSVAETSHVFRLLDADRDGFVSTDDYAGAARGFYLSDDPDHPGNLIAGRL
jgi:hypothetical protein